MPLAKIPAAGIQHGILYHCGAARRTIARDDSKHRWTSAPGERYDTLKPRQRVVYARTARMKVEFLYPTPPAHLRPPSI